MTISKIFVRELMNDDSLAAQYILSDGSHPDDVEFIPKTRELELLERIENLHRDIRVAKILGRIDG